MCSLARLHVPERATDIRSVAGLDGLPMTAKWVKDGILEKEQK